jgi:hypothetical protein
MCTDGDNLQRGRKLSASKTPTEPSMKPAYTSWLSHEYVAFEIEAEKESRGTHCKCKNGLCKYLKHHASKSSGVDIVLKTLLSSIQIAKSQLVIISVG